MPKANVEEIQGDVLEALPNTMFRVQIDEDAPEDWAGRSIICTLSGKMRMYRIRVMPGDRVTVEVTPYDQNKGRITFRNK